MDLHIEKIKLDHIAKSFGAKEVLKGINLSINESETVVLLGPSGCGKTTLLRLINRLEEPDQGGVLIDGKPVSGWSKEQLRRGIGYVIQDTGLLPHLTVRENISLAGRISGREISGKKIEELPGLIGLNMEVLDLRPQQLSGGQQQRIGIARALSTDPEIILMDEPFSALDNITRTQLQDDFLNLEFLENKTIILVTHDVQEAFKLGDKIALIDGGKIQQFGTPVELLNTPSNSTVASFLEKDKFVLSLKTSLINRVSIFHILNDNSINIKEKESAFREFLMNYQ
ncbi:MAG: ATP-binding cassette domain-containing protein [Cyclobacteriaceae bacterium]